MNLLQYLGIKTKLVTADQVVITIDVTDRLLQPFGILHGGINATLAETAASLGANAWLAQRKLPSVATGISVNTQHLRTVAAGSIKAVATPLKRGHRVQAWQVQTFNDEHVTSSSTVSLLNVAKKSV